MGELKNQFVRVEPKLWRRARVQALSEDRTMQDLIAGLLREYLKEEE